MEATIFSMHTDTDKGGQICKKTDGGRLFTLQVQTKQFPLCKRCVFDTNKKNTWPTADVLFYIGDAFIY